MAFFKEYLPQSCETCTPGLRNFESAECHIAPKKTATGHRAICRRGGNTALKTLQLNYFNICTVHFLLFCTMTTTNTQLFHKLSHSYMFRNYRVVLRELVISTLPSYTIISNAADGNTIYS